MTNRTVRVSTDSPMLAAMAHPLRRRLLDTLSADGPANVSMLAARTGQAVGNVSHHLKTLAEAQLIAEAPEHASNRREHWWAAADSSTAPRGQPLPTSPINPTLPPGPRPAITRKTGPVRSLGSNPTAPSGCTRGSRPTRGCG